MRFHAIIFIIFSITIRKLVTARHSAQDFATSRNCNEVFSVTTPRYVPYEESYRVKNWLGLWKWKTRTNYKLENHVTYQRRPVCCSGYTQLGSDLCIPHCSSNCGVNGYCAQPDTCRCEEGYEMDFVESECRPICSESCVHGRCTAPDTCTCDDGYRLLPDGYTCEPICESCANLEYCIEPHICRCISGYERHEIDRVDSSRITVNETCKPQCDRECVNADCVEPNVCVCHLGYFDSDGDVYDCEPVCHQGCQNGVCVAPDTCLCLAGYKLQENDTSHCEPVCTDGCINADCIMPEICSCHDGYYTLGEWNHVCIPYCNSSCEHGRCGAPNKCDCEPGYRPTNNYTRCEPECAEDCHQGTCTAPETCSCFEGYRLKNESQYVCEPVCSEECENGQCTAPEECTCDDGYEKKNFTDGSSSRCIVVCECENGFCNETSSLCETCEEGYELTFTEERENSTICKPLCEGGCSGHGQCVEPQKCECDEYYLADNDTTGNPICLHACGADCAHGTCDVERGACDCPYGWTGKYCEEPTVCAFDVPEEYSIYMQLNETAAYDEAENSTRMEEHWTGPSCNSLCLGEINATTKCVDQSDGERSKIICFFNITSQCNVFSVVQSDKYKADVNIISIVMYSLVAVIIVASTVFATLFIRKRKKAMDMELSKSNQHPDKPEEDRLIENENDGISL